MHTTESGLIVAQQGYEHSYHDLVREHVYPGSTWIGYDTFHEVTEAVANEEADIGILAIENSVYGGTPAELEFRTNFDGLTIIREDALDITHQLLGNGIPEEIWSHPVALGQCRRELRARFPEARLVETTDTAQAAYDVADLIASGKENIAAIASRAAGESRDELDTLVDGINDESPNETGFWTIQRIDDAGGMVADGATKTATTLDIPNHPMAFAQVMTTFGLNGVDFSFVQASERRNDSRNGRVIVPFQFKGSWEDTQVQRSVETVKGQDVTVRQLGSFPVGETISV